MEVKVEFIGIIHLLEHGIAQHIAYHHGPFLRVLLAYKNTNGTFAGIGIETEVHGFIVVIDATERGNVRHTVDTYIIGIGALVTGILNIITESEAAGMTCDRETADDRSVLFPVERITALVRIVRISRVDIQQLHRIISNACLILRELRKRSRHAQAKL